MRAAAPFLAWTLLAAGCAASRSMVQWQRRGDDRADLQVHVAAAMPELVHALHAALGRPAGAPDDCALFVNRWDPQHPDAVHVTATDLELGAMLVCGPNAGSLIAFIARGAVHVTPAGGGPVYWTDRPLREARDRSAELPRAAAALRAAEQVRAHRDTVFVVEASLELNAYDMLRVAQELAALGATVVFYPSRERAASKNE